MPLVLAPAIALMNRLGYTGKFALLWLTSLIAVSALLWQLYLNLDREIQGARQELQGIALAGPILRTVQTLQEHRGLTIALLGGNIDMHARRSANERATVAAFAALERELTPALRNGAEWQKIARDWRELQRRGLTRSADKNFTMHTRLIDQLLAFKLTVSGEYVLPGDPQPDTAALIDTTLERLPAALEHLGQLRALGTRALAQQHLSESNKILLSRLMAQLDSELAFIQANLARAARHNPRLQPALQQAGHDLTTLPQQTLSRIETDILGGRYYTSPESFFALASAAIDRGYTQMHQRLLPTTRTLLEQRIARAQNALYVSIGAAAGLCLIAIYLSIGIYFATTRNIQALARAARDFARGQLQTRVALDTRDELRQVGDSFNLMAEGFNAMLDARQRDEARLRITIETALDAVVQMDDAGLITGWNAQAEKIFGWTREEAIGRPLRDTIIPPGRREAHLQGLHRFVETGEAPMLNARLELSALHRDGHEFPVELAVTPIRIAGRYEFNAFIRDITDRKATESIIWQQANFDTLTGLPNRHMFYDRLAFETRKAQRSGHGLALLFIDLDRFKEVNDTLGHDAGDLLLVEAAARIGDCVRGTDTVARIGGDEFTVILAELAETANIDQLAQNIMTRLNEPFQLRAEVVYLSASIGITLYPNDATEIEDLLKNADQAMYVAKNHGRNRHSYFTPALQQAAQARLRLIGDLRGAIAGGQLRVYFQPIVDLTSCRIVKAEALVRWAHPTRGLVSPAEFIPLTEETGMIVEIGDWVFREAMRWAKRWRALYQPELQISVNKSPRQFRSEGERNCLAWPEYLRQLELPGQSLAVEITEGELLDEAGFVTARLLEFRDAGIQISIDDFGTGYSSLSYLSRFNIDYLKIDRSFIRNLTPGSTDMVLAEAIVAMAHKMGFEVIAEGVETDEQHALLRTATGCNYAQGYLFSAPLPPEEFEALLAKTAVRCAV